MPLRGLRTITDKSVFLSLADSSKSRGFNNRQLSESERDRSIWTDSPAERERKRKAAMMEEAEDPRQRQQRPAPKPAAPPPVVVVSAYLYTG